MSIQGAKLLTMILAGVCGVLLLLAITLQAGFGRGYRWLPADDDAIASLAAGGIDRTPFKLPPESKFAQTVERPLFNEDRKPTPDLPAEAAAPAAPPVPLNVSLTGVILTPELHLAMIHDNGKNDSAAIKEGMPLPGDLGGWTLTRVKARSAIFREMAGDEVEVELSTAVASPKAGAGGPPARPGGRPAGVGGSKGGNAPPAPAAVAEKGNQAEELQHRIEERRKQMRDEAERLKQQQKPPQH
jgi:general secretion pathway protein N